MTQGDPTPPTLPYQSNQPQPPPRPVCQKCGARMLQGLTVTEPRSTQVTTCWIEGEAKRGFLGIKLPKSRRFEVLTFRCPGCGYLESYAPPG
jgi:hypothetical protein